MVKNVEFGIGFLAGRPNVCNIVNSYYQEIVKQAKMNDYNVNFTIFILFDLEYQSTNREQFYNITDEVKKYITIEYITPENIQEEKDNLIKSGKFTEEEVNLILGKGYAKARNSIMYFALKNKIDYLLFWDDDEYPLASYKNEKNEIIWEKQCNVLEHLKNIVNANVTIGYRCGNMSPIPLIEFNPDLRKTDFKKYIEAVSNEAISWEKVKKMMYYENGIRYADEKVLRDRKVQVVNNIGKKNWLLGSGVCINLQKLDNVPPFYNPPEARGEDAFFSTWLTNEKVLKIPTYHFHDSFLKYTELLEERYPTELIETNLEDGMIEKRFLDASIGWIKYKPLLIYISRRNRYRQIMNKTKKMLQQSVSKVNKVFKDYDFSILLEELEKYDTNVEKHYEEYLKTFEVWNKLKTEMKNNTEIKTGIKKEI